MIDPVTFLDKILIPHKAFMAATDRIDLCLRSAHEMSEPVGFALLGPSGSGKSRVLSYLVSRYPRERGSDGLTIPTLSVSVPPKPTIKGLGAVILRGLDEHDVRRYTEEQLTRRIKVLMQQCETKVLMLDEFQHVYDKQSHTAWHHVAEWLNALLDSFKRILVVSGLPDCAAVIEQNPLLARKFRPPLRMPRFSWTDEVQRREFVDCLGSFHAVISEHYRIPALHRDEWSFRCYCATGGLIGYLKQFLSELMLHANVEKKRTLSLRDFEIAYTNYLYSSKELEMLSLRPFSSRFPAEATHDTLKVAAMIGSPVLLPCDRNATQVCEPRGGCRPVNVAAKKRPKQ